MSYYGFEAEDREMTIPTFEDLAIDDDLSDVQLIVKYSVSNIALQRLVYVRQIGQVAKAEGLQVTKSKLFPLLSTLVKDVEFVVRQALAMQFPDLAQVCSTEESGYDDLLHVVLEQLKTLLMDNHSSVLTAAKDSLIEVAKYIKLEDQGPFILTIILSMAHDDDHEDRRTTAAHTLNDLAEILGRDLCHQFVTPEIISLSEDPAFRVRKAAASSLHNIWKTADSSYSQARLLPTFKKLAQDDIWGVRKAAAEALPNIAEASSEELRMTELLEVFDRLVTDASKWVRITALQGLGRYIATFPFEVVPNALIRHYKNMVCPSGGTELANLDRDLILSCAFHFPGVVLTLGKERWYEVRDTFMTLIRDQDWKVRRTLSFSLHQLAKILGPEITEKDLLDAFDMFRKDLDEVRIGVIEHLADFFAALEPATRESCLPCLHEILADTPYALWRVRQTFVSQLSRLIDSFSPAIVYSQIKVLVFDLMEDRVSEVREAALHALGPLVCHLSQVDESWKEELVDSLLVYARHGSYKRRQLFIILNEIVVKMIHDGSFPESFFVDHLFQPLLNLSHDKVPNIRMAVAKLLNLDMLPQSCHPSNHAGCADALSRLSADKDVDVVFFACGEMRPELRAMKKHSAEAEFSDTFQSEQADNENTLIPTDDSTLLASTMVPTMIPTMIPTMVPTMIAQDPDVSKDLPNVELPAVGDSLIEHKFAVPADTVALLMNHSRTSSGDLALRSRDSLSLVLGTEENTFPERSDPLDPEQAAREMGILQDVQDLSLEENILTTEISDEKNKISESTGNRLESIEAHLDVENKIEDATEQGELNENAEIEQES